jgi:acetoacetyl-CoA synthetase
MFPPSPFFPKETLNVAEFLLRDGEDDDVAIHFIREGAPGAEKVTWRDLRSRTRAIRDAMINSGVQVGDVIASVISNSVDAMVICLATLSIGALWSSASPELGVDAIVDRYAQIKPKLVFADDGYFYAGKLVKLEGRIKGWSSKLDKRSDKNLSDVIVIPYCKISVDVSKICNGSSLEQFLLRGTGNELLFSELPFSHPAFIIFSSGTVITHRSSYSKLLT